MLALVGLREKLFDLLGGGAAVVAHHERVPLGLAAQLLRGALFRVYVREDADGLEQLARGVKLRGDAGLAPAVAAGLVRERRSISS